MIFKIKNNLISAGRIVTIVFFLGILIVFSSCNPPAEKKKKKEKEPINEHEEASIYFDSSHKTLNTCSVEWI